MQTKMLHKCIDSAPGLVSTLLRTREAGRPLDLGEVSMKHFIAAAILAITCGSLGNAQEQGNGAPGGGQRFIVVLHDGVDVVPGQDVAQPAGVVNVALDDRGRRTNGIRMAGREIVVHDYALTACGERLHGMAADVSGSAGDEDRGHGYGRPIEK